MALITNNPNFPTPAQISDNSIMDINGRQCYLGNQFTLAVGTVSLADTAEHPVLYTLNPSTNTKSLFKSLRSLNVADNSGAVAVFRIYKNPTGVSGGTGIPPQNCRLASTITSGATVLKIPTVSTNGTLLSTIAVGFNAQNIDSTLFICDPGQALLITCAATTPCLVTADAIYYEI